jgi:HTH-type transcriptional regulator, competence development regulator
VPNRRPPKPPLNTNQLLGSLIRQIRLNAGESLKSAAPKLDVDYSYLSKIENGISSPSTDLLTRFAAEFGTDPDALFLAAGRLPPDIESIVKRNPQSVMTLIRRHFKSDDIDD